MSAVAPQCLGVCTARVLSLPCGDFVIHLRYCCVAFGHRDRVAGSGTACSVAVKQTALHQQSRFALCRSIVARYLCSDGTWRFDALFRPPRMAVNPCVQVSSLDAIPALFSAGEYANHVPLMHIQHLVRPFAGF